MKNRHLGLTALYAVFSLGVYELVWLNATRKELMQLTGIRMPSVKWLAGLWVFRFSFVMLSIFLVMSLSSLNEPDVSSTCWSEYTIGSATETQNESAISEACKNEVEAGLAASAKQDTRIKVYLALTVLLIISWVVYPRWLRNYTLAVSQITNGKWSQTGTTLVLVFMPYSLGIVFVQNEFNKYLPPGSMHSDNPGVEPAPYVPRERKTLKKILGAIALVSGTLLLLFVLAYFLLF